MIEATYNSSDLIDNDLPTFNTTMSPSNILPEIRTSFSSSTFQPIDSTFTAIILSIAGAEFVATMYMHYLVLKMSKRDNSLMNCLMPDMALNVLVGGAVKFTMICIVISLSEPAKEVIGVWFCHVASIIGYIWLFKVWIYSLLVSILRYLYVVYNEKRVTYFFLIS